MRALLISGLLSAFMASSSSSDSSVPAQATEPPAPSGASAATQHTEQPIGGRTEVRSEVFAEVHAADHAGDAPAAGAPDTPSTTPTGPSASTPSVEPTPPVAMAVMAATGAALTVLHGERSQLEAQKQLLTLQLDIATLQRKLSDLEHGTSDVPAAATARAASPALMDPPPQVVSRRGFDGRYSAVLQMRSGGELTVQPGDALPHGKVEHIDPQGVSATWYGRRVRLLDAVRDEAGAGASTRALNLTLPPPPLSLGQP